MGETEHDPKRQAASANGDDRSDKIAAAIMINVLHVIDTGGPGGAETVFLHTATRLDPAQFRSTAIVNSHGWLSERLCECGLQPRVLSAKGSFNTRYLRELIGITRETRADVIVAHLYGTAIYAGIAGAITRTPVISVLHGQTDVSGVGRLPGLKSAIVRRHSRKIVFVSERLQAAIAPQLRLPSSSCVVIPNGVDTAVFRPSDDRPLRAQLGLARDTVLVGAVGNVRPAKAYDTLLNAAAILLRSGGRYHFAIAGECSNKLGREIIELSRKLDIRQQVSFLGLRSDVARVLNSLDVFVISSSTEGFSIACIEAMACGVPIVATRSGGPEQILAEGTGVLVPTGEPAALAGGIERIATSHTFAATLIAAALKRVQEEYSLAKMISRYEDLLAQVGSPQNLDERERRPA